MASHDVSAQDAVHQDVEAQRLELAAAEVDPGPTHGADASSVPGAEEADNLEGAAVSSVPGAGEADNLEGAANAQENIDSARISQLADRSIDAQIDGVQSGAADDNESGTYLKSLFIKHIKHNIGACAYVMLFGHHGFLSKRKPKVQTVPAPKILCSHKVSSLCKAVTQTQN